MVRLPGLKSVDEPDRAFVQGLMFLLPELDEKSVALGCVVVGANLPPLSTFGGASADFAPAQKA